MASRGESSAPDEREDHVQSAVTKALNPAAPEFGPVWPLSRPMAQRNSAALRPLVFTDPAPEPQDRSVYLHRSRDLPLPCVMCEQCFGTTVGEGGWESARDQLLQHLLEAHKIVVHQVSLIASLRRWEESRVNLSHSHTPLLCPLHPPSPSSPLPLFLPPFPLLHRYCEHWRERFSHSHISQFCPVIRTNTHPSGQRSCPVPLCGDASMCACYIVQYPMCVASS